LVSKIITIIRTASRNAGSSASRTITTITTASGVVLSGQRIITILEIVASLNARKITITGQSLYAANRSAYISRRPASLGLRVAISKDLM
jgi:hypothetical protein